MVDIVIGPGESVNITLKDADGQFTVAWTDKELLITANMPDTQGREGIIYREEFGYDDQTTRRGIEGTDIPPV